MGGILDNMTQKEKRLAKPILELFDSIEALRDASKAEDKEQEKLRVYEVVSKRQKAKAALAIIMAHFQ